VRAAVLCRSSDVVRSFVTCRIFIGQASGKGVGVGMKQAEQKKVLTDFRCGAFNTLVATCIGEEGLDIPQASLRGPDHADCT